jgi:hypothetical protein
MPNERLRALLLERRVTPAKLAEALAPVFHLRKIPGGDMVSTCRKSYERVWNGAKPYEGN